MAKKIIIVDDDDFCLEILDIILHDAGYEVHCSLTSEIFDRIMDIEPNLILLDHWLIDEKGSDICERVKNDAATMHIPVLLISAVPNINGIAAKCKADDFLEKPFEIDDLLEKIKKTLEQNLST